MRLIVKYCYVQILLFFCSYFSVGTVLGSSRGGFNEEAIFEHFIKMGVNQVYIVGGNH
jgi:hypothetical protein